MSEQAFAPDRKYITKMILTIWLVFLLGVFPFVFLALIPELGWVYLVLFLLGNAIWLALAHILVAPYYRSISYELADEEVIVRKGIVTKTENVVPYRMITNVSVKRGPLDRLLGMGTLEIHTAGHSQNASPEAQLSGLSNYAQIHEAVLAALRRYRQEAPAAVAAQATADDRVAALLGEILEEVKGLRSAQS